MAYLDLSVVHDLEGFRALEEDWTTVHRSDPQATVFTSWAWILGRISALDERWLVLVARDEDGTPLGFLPLRSLTEEDGVLAMAGSPLADTTGFLCVPGRQDSVLAAFARRFRELDGWRRLEFRDVLDSRLDSLVSHFEGADFAIERRPPTPCPFAELEDTWELYLRRQVGSSRRQTLRRQLRKIGRLEGLRFTSLSDGAETQIAALLELWQKRWGRRPERELAEFRSVFRACLDADTLWLDAMWRDGTGTDDEPMAALAAFLDRPRSRFCFYISGYDERFAEWSPGMVMVLHSLRTAIRDGFRVYDFLRGDEDYKYSLGAQPAETANVDVLRR